MVGMMLCAISGTWNLAVSAASVMSQTAGDGAAEAEGAALHHADHRDLAAPEGAVAVEHHVVAAAQLRSASPAGPRADVCPWSRGRRRNPRRHRAGPRSPSFSPAPSRSLVSSTAIASEAALPDLGPVQGDFQHRALAGGQDLVGHGRSFWQWNFAPKEFQHDPAHPGQSFLSDCSAIPSRVLSPCMPAIPGDRRPQTEPTLRAIAMPADANPHGDIFGGWLLSQMDLAGGTGSDRDGQRPHGDRGGHRHDLPSPGLHRRRGDLLCRHHQGREDLDHREGRELGRAAASAMSRSR